MSNHALSTLQALGLSTPECKGSISTGGALWHEAQAKGASFDSKQTAILFVDGSRILFENEPGSLFDTLYRAVA